jgi:hypothetical protein
MYVVPHLAAARSDEVYANSLFDADGTFKFVSDILVVTSQL